MNSWVVRLGDARSQLAEEDSALSPGVSGWWLIEKSGLNESQLTMLQTATNGSYNLPEVVPALLRLFPNIQVSERDRKATSGPNVPRISSWHEKKGYTNLRRPSSSGMSGAKKGYKDVHFTEMEDDYDQFEAFRPSTRLGGARPLDERRWSRTRGQRFRRGALQRNGGAGVAGGRRRRRRRPVR